MNERTCYSSANKEEVLFTFSLGRRNLNRKCPQDGWPAQTRWTFIPGGPASRRKIKRESPSPTQGARSNHTLLPDLAQYQTRDMTRIEGCQRVTHQGRRHARLGQSPCILSRRLPKQAENIAAPQRASYRIACVAKQQMSRIGRQDV